MKRYIAASLICADPLNLEADVKEINSGGADFIHFDVMDGQFVPRYGLYPEILVGLKKVSQLPVDVHLMVNNPEDFIDEFSKAGADYFCFHIEATNHSLRLIQKIKAKGMKPGVAINPGTSINLICDIIKDVQMVVVMAINPGILGQSMIPGVLDKITRIRAMSNEAGNKDLIIQIDGGVTFDTALPMISSGANMLVCGTGTIFRRHEDTISNKIKLLKEKVLCV
jgi:ribulose-phosphate 3-epimerase